MKPRSRAVADLAGVLAVALLLAGALWARFTTPIDVAVAQVVQTATPWATGVPTVTPLPTSTATKIATVAPTPVIVVPTQYGASPDGLTLFLYLYDERMATVTYFTVDKRDGRVLNLFVLPANHTAVLGAGGQIVGGD